MEKAVLLCRVSSKEQEEGYSLDSQQRLLNDYANQKEFSVSKTFKIAESASGHKQRQIFNSMLEYVENNNIKEIVCEKVDRLTRNLKDAVDVNEWIGKDPERQVHFVKEGVVLNFGSKSNEKFIWNIKVSVAQYYIDNLSEEVKKGQKEKLAQGWLPTRPKIGYKTVGDKGHRIHVIDETKSPFIHKLFELYASGNYSLKKLMDKIYDDGLRSESGRKIPKSGIHRILSEPYYIGFNRWNGQLTPGKHETFISNEIFNKVQGLMTRKNAPKYGKHNYIFKSVIKCKGCGGIIAWETKKGILYAHCNHYRDCKQKTYSKEYEVVGQLMERGFQDLVIENPRLVDWLRRALKEGHKDEAIYHSSAIEELSMRYKLLTNRLDQMYIDKLDGKIEVETYNRNLESFTAERQEVAEQIKKHSSADKKYKEIGANLFEITQKASKIFQESKNILDKRSLINLVFTNLELDEGKLSFEYSKEFQLLSELATEFRSSKMLQTVRKPEKIFELEKVCSGIRKTHVTAHMCSSWLGDRDSNPGSLDQNQVSCR
jgi:site-specific DNA recombinase